MILHKKKYALLLLTLCGIVFFVAHSDSSFVTAEETASSLESSGVLYPEYVAPAPAVVEYEYIEITQSCGPAFEGRCIPVYSGPGVGYEELAELRNGMVLKIKSKEVRNGQVWYHVYFDEWLRHPERVEGSWYIPAVAGRVVTDDGERSLITSETTSPKRIIVSLSDHMLYAYEGDKEFLVTKVSTGASSTPTPKGTFTIYKKTPSRYMQGPLPGVNDNPFDLPGVPWNLYFTEDGAVIHGSYWHDRYGTDQSSGCINLPPELAKLLYDWADLGTVVEIAN